MKKLENNDATSGIKFRKDRFVIFVYALVAVIFVLQFAIIFYPEFF